MDKNIFNRSAKLLELDGIELLSLRIIEKEMLEVEINDRNYVDVAQMLGRASRILAKTVPIQVKVFKLKIIDYQSGLEITEVEILRQAIRENELAFDGPRNLWNAVDFDNPSTTINREQLFSEKKLTWSFYPDIEIEALYILQY